MELTQYPKTDCDSSDSNTKISNLFLRGFLLIYVLFVFIGLVISGLVTSDWIRGKTSYCTFQFGIFHLSYKINDQKKEKHQLWSEYREKKKTVSLSMLCVDPQYEPSK